ncbi:MAG: lipopolysaccharide biosynthesis protein [Pirellulales bacterium]
MLAPHLPSAADKKMLEASNGEILRSSASRRLEWLWETASRHKSVIRTVATSFVIFTLWAVQGAVLARLLGPTARGEYGTAVLYAQLLMFIGLWGGQMTIARRAAASHRSHQQLRNAAMRYGLCTGLGTLAVVCLLALLALPKDKEHLMPLCMLCGLILPWEQMRLAMASVDHGGGAFTRYNICRLATAAMLPLLLIGLWLLDMHSLATVATMTVVASIAGFAIQWLACPQTSLRGPSAPPIQELAAEGMPYALGIVVGNLYGRLDMLLMLWLADLTAQGNYAAAIPTANLLIVAPVALELFAFNVGARPGASPHWKKIVAAGAGLAAVQFLMAVAFAIVLEPLMVLVFGEDFRAAVPLALALLPAFALTGCAMLAEGYLRGRGRPNSVTVSHVLGAAVLVCGSMALFGRYQALAIPLAACASRVVTLLWLTAAVALETRTGSQECVVEGAI